MSETLTKTEAGELQSHEATIERNGRAFIEVGNALLAIRDARLYRHTHETFEAYCRERWGFSRPKAYQLMEAAGVVSTIVDKGLSAPTNESQARPLAALAPAQQVAAWQAATGKAQAEGRTVTAQDVTREVNALGETEVESSERGREQKGVIDEKIIDPMDDGRVPASSETYTSETIAGLKRYWKRATKKERKEFLAWVKK